MCEIPKFEPRFLPPHPTIIYTHRMTIILRVRGGFAPIIIIILDELWYISQRGSLAVKGGIQKAY